jgi:hypothetical protein
MIAIREERGRNEHGKKKETKIAKRTQKIPK